MTDLERDGETQRVSQGSDVSLRSVMTPDQWKQVPSEWKSTPEPPQGLWDIDDAEVLEKVRCNAKIRIIKVDPKEGTYSLRMKCHWTFRTLNSGDRTETHLRVPGIRMPGLVVVVEESRIWRDLKKTTDKTVYWSGTSLFHISGYEIFEMTDFPFDRQLINLELLEFVWRSSKDTDTFDFSMKLVNFKLFTTSMLPNWQPFPSVIYAENETYPSDTSSGVRPTFASRFQVQLKIQRNANFHIYQTFLVTCLITAIACFPLALPPTQDFVAKRLAAYALGILTLVSYKYGIADQLPKVPYPTYADMFMLAQIVTVTAMAIECLIAYRLVNWGVEETIVDIIEAVFLVFLLAYWLFRLLYAGMYKSKHRKEWGLVLQDQDVVGQASEDNQEDDANSLA